MQLTLWFLKIGRSAIAATARYQQSNDVTLIDAFGQIMGYYNPQEFAIDLAYSRRFGDYLSAGLAGRFIYSGLTVESLGYSAKSYSVACDVSAYYQRPLGSLVDLPDRFFIAEIIFFWAATPF